MEIKDLKQYKEIFVKYILYLSALLAVSYLGLTLFPILSNNRLFLNQSVHNINFFQRFSYWDGHVYTSIAKDGYGKMETDFAFWPFYPIVIKFVSFFTFNNYLLSALTVSYISFFGVIIYLYKLVKLDFGERVAKRTVDYILLFPTSFFFISSYTESLYLFLTLLSFYYMRKSLFLKSGIFIMLANATRIVGIALIPSLIFELFKRRQKSISLKNIIGLMVAPLGTLLYMAFLFISKHDMFYFLTIDKAHYGRTQITVPFKPLLAYIKHFSFSSFFQFRDQTISSLEFFISLIFLIIIIVSFKKLPKSYFVYSIIAWSFPLVTGVTGSMMRYVIIIFPCFIMLGLFGQNKYFDRFYTWFSCLLLGILTVSFVNGYWVG